MSIETQSRGERAKRGKNKRVKVVIDERFKKAFKYSWFPVSALVLFVIGLQIGVYYISNEPDGSFQTIFNKNMWSGFWDAIKNF